MAAEDSVNIKTDKLTSSVDRLSKTIENLRSVNMRSNVDQKSNEKTKLGILKEILSVEKKIDSKIVKGTTLGGGGGLGLAGLLSKIKLPSFSGAQMAVMGFLSNVSAAGSNFVGGIGKTFDNVKARIGGIADSIKATFSNIIGGIANFFKGIIEKIQNIIKSIIGGITGFFKNIGNMITGFFSGIFGKLGKVFANLGRAIVSFLKPAAEAFRKLFSDPKVIIGVGIIAAALTTLIIATGQFEKAIRSIAEVIGNVLVSIFKVLAELLAKVLPYLVPIIKAFADFFTKTLPFAVPILKTLGEVAAGFLTAIIPVIQAAGSVIREILPLVQKFLMGVIPVFGAFLDVIASIFINLKPLIEFILPILKEVVLAILPILKDLIKAITPVLKDLLPTILALGTAIRDIVVGAFRLLGDAIGNIMPVVQSIIDLIKDVFIGTIKTLGNIVSEVMNALTTPFKTVERIVLAVKDTILGIGNQISTVINNIVTKTGEIVNKVLDKIPEILKLIKDMTLLDIVKLGAGLKTVGDGIGNILSKFTDFIRAGGADGLMAISGFMTSFEPLARGINLLASISDDKLNKVGYSLEKILKMKENVAKKLGEGSLTITREGTVRLANESESLQAETNRWLQIIAKILLEGNRAGSSMIDSRTITTIVNSHITAEAKAY